MRTAKVDPSLLQSARNTEIGEKFNQTLFSALDALEERGIGYALIGGVASSGLGRPRSTHDIDVFVRPEDAGSALEALERKGFETEKTDFAWLFKAFKDGILVDIIFKSRGDIYYDTEMHRRAAMVEYHGRKVRAVSPEDLIIIKCVVHDEVGPHHWHDALAILSHASLDWSYLLKRARRAPRRLLSLLFYAQSNDIWVPNWVILDLFHTVFGDVPAKRGLSDVRSVAPAPLVASDQAQPKPKVPEAYVTARVKDALAESQRIGQQDFKILVQGNTILIRGEVPSEERRRAVTAVLEEAIPGYRIDNQVTVAVLPEPEGSESVG